MGADFTGLADAGAFWSGVPNSSGLLPEPKHFWYDIHEYRLNSKPHIRRILQHQQAQAGGSIQAGAEASAAAGGITQIPESSSKPQLLQHQEVHEDGSTQASAAPGVAAGQVSQVPESSKGMAAHPQPVQLHDCSAQAPAAPAQAFSNEHMSSNSCQPLESAQQEQRAASAADAEGRCAARNGGADGKRPAHDSWQPVTASQILKRQRVAGTAPQISREPHSSAAACQQVKPEPLSLSHDSMREGTTGPDILLQPSEQEACDESGAFLETVADPGQHVDSEESCEDVLAMWGEAGEPDQDFAWAEAPAGLGDGSAEANSASKNPVPSSIGHRMWACQVCSLGCLALCHGDYSLSKYFWDQSRSPLRPLY